MRIFASAIATGLLAVVAWPDDAQAQSRSRGVAPPMRARPASPRRGSEPRSAPRGSGIIQWNTPNASGNLGGPGAGGGGGTGA